MLNPFEGKNGPLLIAEIGGNHEGDFDYAKRLAQLAIETDVDVVKFQVYTGNTLVSSVESPDRNAHFKKFELTKQQHIYLAEMVKESGKEYTSSVWDFESLEWIDKYINIYKVGSGDLTAYPLLKKIALIGKPIVLSTGLSYESEVLASVDYIQKVNSMYRSKDKLAILQCTSMYPIQNSDANLGVMNRLQELTGLTIGYSDHTEGCKALVYAVALGAQVLEFHFTDTRMGKIFRDHKVSLTPTEISDLVSEIVLFNEFKGCSEKQPIPVEIENNHDVTFRRAVYPSRDILAGEVLSEENLTILRPNHGIDARYYESLINKKAAVNLYKHQKLSFDLIN